MFPLPAPFPVWADARPRQNALLAFGVCHSALLFVGPARHRRGGAFLPRQGLGVFRHSRVSGKTLTNP